MPPPGAEESRAILALAAKTTPAALPAEADKVLEALGGLPLELAMVRPLGAHAASSPGEARGDLR